MSDIPVDDLNMANAKVENEQPFKFAKEYYDVRTE